MIIPIGDKLVEVQLKICDHNQLKSFLQDMGWALPVCGVNGELTDARDYWGCKFRHCSPDE